MKNSGNFLKTAIAIPVVCAGMICFLLSSCAPRYGCYFSHYDVQQPEAIQQAEEGVASEACAESVIDLSCTASR